MNLHQFKRLVLFSFIGVPYEAYYRLKDMIRPEFYSYKRRVQVCFNKNGDAPNSNSAVIAVFSQGHLSDDMRQLIKDLNKKKISVVISCNGYLDDVSIEFIKKNCHQLLLRKNIGRDLGAYKDGLHYLQNWAGSLSNIMLFNDSVYYLSENIDEMLKLLFSKKKICSATESCGPVFHLQSYCINIPKPIIKHNDFWAFWDSYLPYSTRYWAIQKGEFGFSHYMKEKGLLGNSIYTLDEILIQENFQTVDDLYRVSKLVPEYYKHEILNTIESGDLRKDTAKERILEVAENVLNKIRNHSQVHMLGFLFIQKLKLPFIKRDILSSAVYEAPMLEETFKTLELDKKINLSSLSQKKPIQKLNKIERILLNLGFK